MEIQAGQHAFITGGASGIGLGIAQALAARGVVVTIADISTEARAEVEGSLPSDHLCVPLDVRDRNSWQAAYRAASGRFGAVDILINNAGISFDGDELVDIKPESFHQIVGINLEGVYNGLITIGPQMREQGFGHIINTASVMALVPGLARMGIYSATKAAVVALSEALRGEMAPYGVGVSVLCPGLVTSNLRANTVKLGGIIKTTDRHANAKPTEMPAREAGELVVRGISENLPYILTHLNHLGHAEQRLLAIRASAEKIHEGC